MTSSMPHPDEPLVDMYTWVAEEEYIHTLVEFENANEIDAAVTVVLAAIAVVVASWILLRKMTCVLAP